MHYCLLAFPTRLLTLPRFERSQGLSQFRSSSAPPKARRRWEEGTKCRVRKLRTCSHVVQAICTLAQLAAVHMISGHPHGAYPRKATDTPQWCK